MHSSALIVPLLVLFNHVCSLPQPHLNSLAKRIPSVVWGPGAFQFSAAGTPIIVLDNGVLVNFQIADSNFVVYKDGKAQWNSRVFQPAGCISNKCFIVFQNNGDLVSYFNDVAVWSSGTGAGLGAWLVFFDVEPYIVIYGHDLAPLWHTPITPPAAPPVPHRAFNPCTDGGAYECGAAGSPYDYGYTYTIAF